MLQRAKPQSVSDKYDDLYNIVPTPLTSPWTPPPAGTAGPWTYEPDFPLLEALIDETVQSGKAFVPRSAALAAATNVWVATELRRAGIDPDRVWPRTTRPRVLAWDAAAAAKSFKLRKDPKRLPAQWGASKNISPADLRIIQEQTIEAFLAEIGKGRGLPLDPTTNAPKDPANILGAHFPKEIDISMARYDRGLELGISTKTMQSSPANNIPNRREEASGDLLNIRRRFPLSAFGYFFLVEKKIADNAGYFGKIIDMCRKVMLSTRGDDANAYDASCLIVVELHQAPAQTTLHETLAPDDLGAPAFFTKIMDCLMQRSQFDDHVEARKLWLAAGRGP